MLTFDDGPWPDNTRAVLEALAHHCTKATFFPIGKHALWHPEILKEVAAAAIRSAGTPGRTPTCGEGWPSAREGDAINGRRSRRASARSSWRSAPLRLRSSASRSCRTRKDAVAYLGTRNIAIFSHDLDSFDFKMRKPEDVVKSVMSKLERKGKGIILMHDFQQATRKAMPDLLNQLKAKGYKVVHMKAKAPAATIPEFDQAALAEFKGPISVDRPTSSVVRTVD